MTSAAENNPGASFGAVGPVASDASGAGEAAVSIEHAEPPVSVPETFVDFRDAGFTYDGETFVFKNLSLTVPQGQFLCLLYLVRALHPDRLYDRHMGMFL